jgi:hypothetical protein
MRNDNAADGRFVDGLYGRLNWRRDRPDGEGVDGEGAGADGPVLDRNVRRGAGRTTKGE